MKEIKTGGKNAGGEGTRRSNCSCGHGGGTEGTHAAGQEHGSKCSCSCGPNETTDSVLTGAGGR